MCQTLASSISIAKLLAHGPWARPMLDPMRFRLLFPSAAEIEERQTGLPTGHPSSMLRSSSSWDQ